MINSSFDAVGMSILPDINLTGYEDFAVIAVPTGGGNNLIKLRDLETGANIDTLTITP